MIEEIQVRLSLIQRGMALTMNKTRDSIQSVTNSMSGFRNVMLSNFSTWKNTNDSIKNVNTSGGRLANTLRMATHGLRGFKMEMLSVMFFGMAMNQLFMGLLQPTMKMFGVFDLWSSVLSVVFLPVMELLFPYFLDLMGIFMDMPEGLQLAIGLFVVLGAAFTSIMSTVGQVALGIGGIIFAVGELGAIGITVGMITAVFWILLGVVALVVIAAAGIYTAWKTNFGGIREYVDVAIKGIKQVISGLVDTISGTIKMVFGLLTGDTDTFKDGMELAISGIKTTLEGLLNAIVGTVVSLGIGVYKALGNAIDVFYDLAKPAFKWVYEQLINISELFLKIPYLSQGIKDSLNKVIDVSKNAIINLDYEDNLKKIEDSLKMSVNREDYNPYTASIVAPIYEKQATEKKAVSEMQQISIINNFYGFTQNDLDKSLDERDNKIVDKVKQYIPGQPFG